MSRYPSPLLRLSAICALVLVAAGCASDDGASADGDPLRPACVTGKPPADWTYPAGAYGTGVGDVVESFTLPDGDGTDVAFSDVLGDAQLVLLNIGSGWCQPCIDETEHLENDVYRKHCAAGLRVVQVLYQDEQSRPPPKLFVRQWRDRFGLTFPVLQDALFETEKFFSSAASQTPLNLLVDRAGVIRYRRAGEVPADLDAALAELLAR